jgi:hypothetical protein
LAILRDPLLVPEALAQTIQIHETSSTLIGVQVLAYLQDKHLLLVLDNLEQILDSSPFIATCWPIVHAWSSWLHAVHRCVFVQRRSICLLLCRSMMQWFFFK